MVVVTLAWPSHWLIVKMSTPARNKMYRSAMAHAVGVETFVRECRSHRMSSRTMFPENVADAEPGEAGTMTITEERIVGRRRATTLGKERAEDFGRLRP